MDHTRVDASGLAWTPVNALLFESRLNGKIRKTGFPCSGKARLITSEFTNVDEILRQISVFGKSLRKDAGDRVCTDHFSWLIQVIVNHSARIHPDAVVDRGE